jgi:hypothetical protein
MSVNENNGGQVIHERALELLNERGVEDATYRQYLDALVEVERESKAPAEGPEVEAERERMLLESAWTLAQWTLEQQGISEPTQEELSDALTEAERNLREAQRKAS